MSIIRVLHIISGNDNGGGGGHVLNLCLYSKDMMESTIGCIGEGFLYSKAKNKEVKTVLFSIKDALNGNIEKYINDNNIDIVNFHGAKPFFMYRFLKRKLHVPCVATVHSDYRYDFLNNRLKYILFTPLSAMGLKKFQNYICVSKYISDVLDENGFIGEKTIVNNGIDVDNIRCIKSRDEIRQMYGINKSDFVYICVARMHPIKNHESLIKAFSLMNTEYSNTRLLLVGDGQIEERLKEQAKQLNCSENIIFCGFQSNVLDYINASDISILVSINEGGAPPLAVLESAAVKKTIICSYVGDIDNVMDSNSGFLTHADSVEDIYEKMKIAFNNKEKLDTMGNNLYSIVQKNFSMENFCNKYYNFYQKMLSSKLK